MDRVASMIIPSGRLMLRYAEMLLEGIAANSFARKPEGIDTNSPAFCYGHLTIYPEHVLTAVGREDLAVDADDYQELFGPAKECRDDPDGTLYPPMDAIMARFRERHKVALGAIEGVSDEVMMRANPREKRREFMPTVGAGVAFYLGGHAMTHLGQVSAWRRAMGLKSVM